MSERSWKRTRDWRLTVRLEGWLEEPMGRMAKAEDRSVNYLINRAVREYVERRTGYGETPVLEADRDTTTDANH